MLLNKDNHAFVGYDATLQIPQVFPLASLMYPSSPQTVPHEFFTNQYWTLTPTKRTPWLRLVLQLLKTPDLYPDQFEASTATEIGLPESALCKSLQFLISTNPAILNYPVAVLQVPLTAVYGYALYVTIPLSLTNLKALSIIPPLQPKFPYVPEQSTSCCSEKLWRFP